MYEQFISFDWGRGLGGRGEVDFGTGVTRWEDFGPEIAESWKIPQIGTWILNIRKGVHYALDPNSEASRLMNGRELTADDAVWNVWRLHQDPRFPNAAPRRSIPATTKSLTVEKTGPSEVTLKTPDDPWNGFFWVTYGGCSQNMYAREVIDKYGHQNDWRNIVGTGPFMITDLVSGSVVTFKKNPNWWQRNPGGPGKGDQVPYVDTLKLLVVPDVSTRLATMRTGRADWVTDIEGEDARGLLKAKAELRSKRLLPGAYGISMRIEKADLPFKDKRVRQALMMATDFEAMKNDLYGSDAEILIHPVAPSFTNLYVPLKDMPESVQALYKYNPEKAKQLLAEAGYPKGFKTKMIAENVSARMDPAAVFKAMWAKVGVDVEIQPRETAAYEAIGTARSWDEMYMVLIRGTAISTTFSMSTWRGATLGWRDQTVEDAFQEMQKNMFVNMPKADETYRRIVPYILDQAYTIPRPTPYSYTIWQPWVKNHSGEISVSVWPPYAWIDQDLKEKMTGRR